VPLSAKTERLDKILADQGFGTRKDVKRLVHSGAVTVNGTAVTDSSVHIDTEHDVLAVDGETVRLQQFVYLMLNKCMNVVCANKDGEHQTVFDLLDDRYHTGSCAKDLHAVGRLDIDTEGLLLLTTDGALTHRLISPKTHVSKTYTAYLRDSLSEVQRADYIKCFMAGIHIAPEDNEAAADCLPADLSWDADVEYKGVLHPCARLVIYEGKYHQVKRMFSALGNEVIYLKRVSMGQLKLDSTLKPGTYRELTEEELALLEKQ